MKGDVQKVGPWFDIDNQPEETASELELVMPGGERRVITAVQAAEILEVTDVLAEHQEKHRYHLSGPLAEIVQGLIGSYRSQTIQQLRRTKEFRDDMLTWLRAVAIVADATSRAATHQEKNARLRGVVDVIEGAISGLRDQKFEIGLYSSPSLDNDVFRSDYPTRELLQTIHKLRDEIDALRKRSGDATERKEDWPRHLEFERDIGF